MNRGPRRYPSESGNVVAMSDFAVDIDAEPGEPFLPSGVHLDMPDFADVDNVSHALECVSFGEPGFRDGVPGVRECVGDVRFRR